MFQCQGHQAGYKVTHTDPPPELIEQPLSAGPEWARKTSVSWFGMNKHSCPWDREDLGRFVRLPRQPPVAKYLLTTWLKTKQQKKCTIFSHNSEASLEREVCVQGNILLRKARRRRRCPPPPSFLPQPQGWLRKPLPGTVRLVPCSLQSLLRN